VAFLRSVFLLKLCSKECLGFGGEIMKFENTNNQMRRKRKERISCSSDSANGDPAAIQH